MMEKKMTRIINWINYHEYEHKESTDDWKNESSALVDMGSRK